MGVVIKIFRWIFEKTATAGLILGLALAAGGLWFFLKDNVDFDEWRHDVLRTLTGERARVQSALDDVQHRLNQANAGIAADLSAHTVKFSNMHKAVRKNTVRNDTDSGRDCH